MRLLHATELRFKEFLESDLPAYGILSHRWGTDEVSYQEMQEVLNPNRTLHALLGTTPPDIQDERYAKIQACRTKALEMNLQWIWVDTCCINKESSAELSEAINSMYRWYQYSRCCFVHMSDVDQKPSGRIQDAEGIEELDRKSFRDSEWFARGWTLQELLAPQRLLFYDVHWDYIGNKIDLADEIAERTCINPDFIRRYGGLGSKEAWSTVSVAMKMSWASARTTSRLEDMAYCLLGLFDVNMPLLYGEGSKAFERLQLEIIKKSDDESIFAWRRPAKPFFDSITDSIARITLIQPTEPSLLQEERDFVGLEPAQDNLEIWRSTATEASVPLRNTLLAQGPSDFADSGGIWPYPFEQRVTRRLPYSMTNNGLLFYVELNSSNIHSLTQAGALLEVPLNCFEASLNQKADSEQGLRRSIAITLRKVAGGEDQHWVRYDCQSLQSTQVVKVMEKEVLAQTAIYIRSEANRSSANDAINLLSACEVACMYRCFGNTYSNNRCLERIRTLVRTMCTSGSQLVLSSVSMAIDLTQNYVNGDALEAILGSIYLVTVEVFGREHAICILLKWMAAAAAGRLGVCEIKSTEIRTACESIANAHGNYHMNSMVSKNCLGLQLLHEESWTEAEALLQDVLTQAEKTLGRKAMITSNILASLSRAQCGMGLLEAAMETINRSLEAAPISHDHPRRLKLLCQKAQMCSRLGHVEEAERCYWTISKVQAATMGQHFAAIRKAYESRTEVLRDNGTWESLRRSSRISERVRGLI